jgi:hypothetical protein
MRIHPVFHVSLLEPHKSSTIPGRSPPLPSPIVVNSEKEFEVEEVLDSKFKRKRLFYLVKWKGYPITDNSWEPAVNLKNASELVNSFHSKYPSRPSRQSTRQSRS